MAIIEAAATEEVTVETLSGHVQTLGLDAIDDSTRLIRQDRDSR